MTATVDNPAVSEYFAECPIGRVHPDPINPRTHIDVDDDFVASIAQGIIEPLIVRPDPKRETLLGEPEDFLLVAGERRHLAATTANLETVPVIVRYDLADDADALEMMIVENGHRESLPPLDEARAYAELVKRGRTQRDVATAVGREQGTVSKRLSLLKLPTRAQQLLDGQRITVRTALGMTGLIKDNGRLSKVLDYATQQADLDDAQVARKVFFELDQMKAVKERAKREKDAEKKRAAAPDDDEPDEDATRDEALDDARRSREGAPVLNDEERDARAERLNVAAAERRTLIENLAGDGYPGNEIAIRYIARIGVENAIENGETGNLCAALGITIEPDTDNEMDAEEAALRSFDPLRVAFADALDIGAHAYNPHAKRLHLQLLADNGYACELPEERALFGDTTPDGNYEDESDDRLVGEEERVIPGTVGGEEPAVYVDETSANGDTTVTETEPLEEPFKAYNAFPIKSILNIINNPDTDTDRLQAVIAYEEANRNDSKIIDAAKARLDAMSAAVS